jgi:hypothetical protein
MFVAPLKTPDYFARVWIEQNFVGVEMVALQRIPKPMGTQAVYQPRSGTRKVTVPNIASVLWQGQSRALHQAFVVKQAQVHRLRVR